MGRAFGHDDPRRPHRGEGRWQQSRVAATTSRRLLMEKAAGDEKILLRLIDDDDIPDDGLGFHAQQAVEKRIKAVLAHNEVVYERTHNIAYLLKLLDDARNHQARSKPDDLPNLSPWAAELRYATTSPDADARPSRRCEALVEQTEGLGRARSLRRSPRRPTTMTRCHYRRRLPRPPKGSAGQRRSAARRKRTGSRCVASERVSRFCDRHVLRGDSQGASALSLEPGLTSTPSTAQSVHRMAIRVYAVRKPAPIAQLDRATPS